MVYQVGGGMREWASCCGASYLFRTCTHFNPQKIQREPVFLLQCCFSLNVTKQKRGGMIPGRQMPEQGQLCNLSTYIVCVCLRLWSSICCISLISKGSFVGPFLWHNRSLTNWYKVSTWTIPTNAAGAPLLRLTAGLRHRTVWTDANLQIMLSWGWFTPMQGP